MATTAATHLLTTALGFPPPSDVIPLDLDALRQRQIESWGEFVANSHRLAIQRRQERLQAAYQSIGIPKRFRGLSLESFAEAVGSDPDKRIALSLARQMAETGEVNGKKSVIFWGEARGIGKTGLATATFARLLGKTTDLQALWLDYSELLDVIRQGFRPNATVDPYALQFKAAQTPLLLIDHFGSNVRQDVSEAVAEITAKIINYRHREDLPTILTTNLSPAALGQQLGEDTYQRLSEMSVWARVGGRVLRQL